MPCGNDCVVIFVENNYHLPISIIIGLAKFIIERFIDNYVGIVWK